MRHGHQSVFTYNISRPYPFRWFTPFVVVSGLLLLALFSYLNYASNGFDLVAVTSSNQNDTVADLSELSGLPGLLTGKYKPKCQPANIVVNSDLFTNQTGLVYKLTAIWQGEEERNVLPVLIYNNNVFKNCNISSIEVEYSMLDRTANQIGFNMYGAIVHTFATCSIDSPTGIVKFNITNDYDFIPPSVSFTVFKGGPYDWTVRSNFVDRNATARASLWWGESIMSTYWSWVTKVVEDLPLYTGREDSSAVGARIRKGTIVLEPDASSIDTDLMNPKFFRALWRFVVDHGAGDFEMIVSSTNDTHPYGYYAADLQE